MTPRRQLLEESARALETFLASTPPSAFSIVRTVGANPSYLPRRPDTTNPRTLFILDSSFNPPSRAHASLALSALRSSDPSRYPKPHRLLLLFSTHNADKEPAPAAFEHRLAMMVEFAHDLADRLTNKGTDNTMASNVAKLRAYTAESEDIQIDVALTTKPYYNDKSDAIASSSPPAYPSRPQHVHLAGFDTVTRIFNPKYYTASPPLSVLDPFFAQHRLRITVRPEGEDEDEEGAKRQLGWAREVLAAGVLEKEGGRRVWAERVEIVEAVRRGKRVSSTSVREAVGQGDWGEVEALCTPRLAPWVREFGLYQENGQ